MEELLQADEDCWITRIYQDCSFSTNKTLVRQSNLKMGKMDRLLAKMLLCQ